MMRLEKKIQTSSTKARRQEEKGGTHGFVCFFVFLKPVKQCSTKQSHLKVHLISALELLIESHDLPRHIGLPGCNGIVDVDVLIKNSIYMSTSRTSFLVHNGHLQGHVESALRCTSR